jgi:dynein heavy chain
MYSFPPANATVTDIIHHVSQFPLLEPPALFGLHENAALTCNRAQATAFFESMMMVQRSSVAVSSGSGAEAAGGGEDGVAAVARDILSRLPPLFDVAAAQAKCGVHTHACARFNCKVFLQVPSAL